MWCHPKQIIVNVSHILPCHNGIMATSKDDMMCVSLEVSKVVAAVWGDRIYAIPCRVSYFAPGRFEE